MEIVLFKGERILYFKMRNSMTAKFVAFFMIFGLFMQMGVKNVHGETSTNELAQVENLVAVDGGSKLYQDGAMEMLPSSEIQNLALETLLRQEILALKSAVDLSSFGLSPSDFLDFYWDFINRNPDLFFLKGQVRYSISNAKVQTVELSYRYGQEEIKAKMAAFDKEVEKVKGLIKPEDSPLEIALLVHDYLVNHVAYDYDNYLNNTIPDSAYSAYGALVEKSAVCNGYGLAYLHLLQNVFGVPTKYISSTTMNHGWNMVEIDGQYYHVDVTWDDPVRDRLGSVQHKYFLLSDAAISKDHAGWVSDVVATSSKYDEAFWQEVQTSFVRILDTYYYIDENQRLMTWDPKTSKTDVLVDLSCHWPANNSGSFWQGGFQKLFTARGMLYVNLPDGIYTLDKDGEHLKKVYGVDVAKGPVVGFSIQDEKAYYIQTFDVNNQGEEKVDISSIIKGAAATGIHASKTSYALTIGERQPLQVEVVPQEAENKDYHVAIGNPKVVGYHEGQLIALENGSTTVTARSIDGDFRSQIFVTVTGEVQEAALTDLTITKYPTKREYFEKESLDLTGLEVEATYSDGSKEKIATSAFTVSGFDSTSPVKRQVVTLSYGGKSISFTVDIIEIRLTGLEIVKYPAKTVYVVGETLDLTGLEIESIYNNGTRQKEDLATAEISGFNSSKPVKGQEVVIRIKGMRAVVRVDIVSKALASIQITKLPVKTTYLVGETADWRGLEVTGTYNDGTKEVLSVGGNHITGFDSSKPLKGQKITVTVNGLTATFTVDIEGKVLESIRVVKDPQKRVYKVGESLNVTGLLVYAKYADGSEESISLDRLTLTGFDSSKPVREQIVTIAFEGKTTTFIVEIIDRTLSGIEIRSLPTKTNYKVGEALSLDGLSVYGLYNNDSEEKLVITMDHIQGFNSSKAVNSQVITVSYGGYADTFVVQISAKVSVKYRTHVQSHGWQDFVYDGQMSGTEGVAKRLEGIEVLIEGNENLGIQYATHVQSIGWQNYVANGKMSGTSGRALRLEAIKLELTGKDAGLYDLYYRVHAQSIGWMGWAKNGQAAGTAGYAYRLEGIEIIVVEKGVDPGLNTTDVYRDQAGIKNVSYRTHVQSIGWQDYVSDGKMSGTSGRALRLEGINISLGDHLPTGSIEYNTHVQSLGWLNPVRDGVMSGTTGRALRLEGIRIKLTGEIAKQYDVYYRVHAQSFGWMGWAKNGEDAGSAGYAYRLEGIEIRLVPKGGKAPGSTENAFRSK